MVLSRRVGLVPTSLALSVAGLYARRELPGPMGFARAGEAPRIRMSWP